MKIMKKLKQLFCKHRNTLTITNFEGIYIEYYKCRCLKICSDCGKTLKLNKPEIDCKIINFVPPYKERK